MCLFVSFRHNLKMVFYFSATEIKPRYVSRQCSEPQKPTDKPTKTEIKSVNLRL